VHCPSGFRRLIAGLRQRSGPPLVGFFVPTTFDSGCPVLPRSARPTVGDEGCHTLARFRPRASSTRPSSPSSPSSPCGDLGAPCALDRASVAPRRFEPRRLLQARVSPLPQFRRRYAPELSQPVARPRPSLGFALQSFPFPRSRAAFRRPSASLRVRRRPCLRREDSWLSDRFPPRASS